MQLEAMAIELPRYDDHPNRVPFRGVLTLLDVPSDKPPAGARGHRVLLTRTAAERALPSLLGMGLDYTPALDRHDARRKIGVITEATIVDGAAIDNPSRRRDPTSAKNGQMWGTKPSPYNASRRRGGIHAGGALVEVSGYLYARDFPEVVRELRAGGRDLLGMSYEIADARIAEASAPVWRVTDFTFTGAALLRRDKAAYRETWIELAN